ncbi:alpha/beta fold hydrolase [Ornithinibacillus halotolerans]|uniref:Hydrolase n=1 Tax=Ornithinibacillus halotolerans TaxID=1274357 RepID=A0A916SAE1_9BACI|nr:alpha/beta hydrolase [Ornithinibacillus halotolerans]GGA90590.1 hydrolase [Ornithinibacillus halotolerans]
MLCYTVYGEKDSDKTIIALPALGERKETYEILSKYMKEYRMIAIDLPGHNQTEQEDYSITTYIKDIRNLMEEWKISTAHFIGNSIGGWIIQAFYSAYPDYVSSLTLLDGGYYFLGEREDFDEEIQLPIIERLEDLEEAVRETTNSMEGLTEEVRENFNTYLLNNFVLQDHVYKHHSNEVALNSLSKEVTKTDFCLKQKVDKPFLLLVAEHSLDDFSNGKVEEFKKVHSDQAVKIISNGHHFLPITNPVEVANILKGFRQENADLQR